MTFIRQACTLSLKNWRILLRHPTATVLRALVVPLAVTIFLGFAKYLFVPPAVYGIGSPHPTRSLGDALALTASSGRNTVAFVNNGFTGGEIERVIDALVPLVTGAGKSAPVLQSAADLRTVCPGNLRGVTPCAGAVVFNASPREGTGGIWNYTLRVDGALGISINVDKDSNDGDLYLLPLQCAVDSAIVNLHAQANQTASLPSTRQYAFTSFTQEERAAHIRERYQQSLIDFLAVGFVAGMLGIVYHQVGFMAHEREVGLSQLIEAMLPAQRWPRQAQAARLVAYQLSFCLVYLPGWVAMGLFVSRTVFARSSALLLLLLYVLTGVALSSLSLLGAALFRKAKFSGITVTITVLLLAILAQSISWPTTVTCVILSVLFTPCTFVYFLTFVARFEHQGWRADLAIAPPVALWNVKGITFFILLVIQAVVYSLLAMHVEQRLHGTESKTRTATLGADGEHAVQLRGFTKIYHAGRWLARLRTPGSDVVAVHDLTLDARRGQILVLLGANGSGKSTTLDAVAGVKKISAGSIALDGTGGLGFAPQKNVLWDDLSVFEHIKVFNRLKSTGSPATDDELRHLIGRVDLAGKMKARASTLSGGQKRKLQLGMMLTGGSSVCCVDEVSSGLDPLSRRKIWDILLAERGKRTIIMTTHYLDEADLLADHIVMLSKGRLRAEGSSVELKETLGAGYKVTVPAVAARDAEHHADGLEGVEKTVASDDSDDVTFVAHSSALAAQLVRRLEDAGLHQYDFAGPSIEDVFLRVADEVKEDDDECASASAEPGEKCAARRGEGGAAKGRLGLLPGARTSFLTQFRTLLHKRLLVFGSNCFPNAAALAIPIIAAGLTTLCIKGLGPVLCGKGDDTFTAGNNQIGAFEGAALNYIVAGPSSKFANDTVEALFVPIMQAEFAGRGPQLVANAAQSLLESLHLVDTYDDFTQHVVDFRTNITPAGIWLGDASSEPTLAYLGNGELNLVVSGQNVMNVMLLNTPITANYGWFNYPWLPSTDSSLQMLAYFGLAMCAFPAFFALYPNTERRRRVRSLEYSNGVRFYPLWLAYLSFDLAFAMVGIALACGIYSATSGIWYGSVGYLFVVFTLYALASILLGYVVSLFCGSQLSTYAFTTAGQAAFFLIYLIVYFCTLTYTPVTRLDSDLLLVHFLVSAFAPIGSVIRALFVTLNLFSAACDGFDLSPHPGGIRLYGGPILYLILQSLLLFVVLIWVDSGAAKTWWDKVGQRLWYHRVLFGRGPRRPAAMRSRPDTAVVSDEEVAEMALAVTAPTEEMPPGSAIDAGRRNPDGLRVLNVSRSFGRNLAIDNATFGVRHGEVFALLGPNGAGKSTLISLICGDLRPDAGQRGGDILVGDASVVTRLAAARARLGVCPQLDAIDQLTVRQHLAFFAAVQGVASRRGGGAQDSNVTAVLRAVGLSAYADRWAASLSGGNKRKLALGIALLGDPDVVLLDEPSSGLDAAAKRVMWRTLRRAGAGRSVLLTTHSLEEADALAGRVGILARRMLAVGTPEELRRRFRDRVLVHLVLATAPRTGREEMEHVRTRLLELFPGAEVEKRMDFGQARVLVPQGDVLARARKRDPASLPAGNAPAPEDVEAAAAPTERSAVGQLVVMLEELKQELGIRSYSVSATTLDQVFLAIVGRHDKVQEENSTPPSTRQASAR